MQLWMWLGPRLGQEHIEAFREMAILEDRIREIDPKWVTGYGEVHTAKSSSPYPPVPISPSALQGVCAATRVLCSALVYTALAWLHRTNSPATGLQQPVAPRNKSSQQEWLYPGRKQQDHGVTLH